MGARKNPDCFKCGKPIDPNDQVVVVTVRKGRAAGMWRDAVESLFHESCYLDKGKEE